MAPPTVQAVAVSPLPADAPPHTARRVALLLNLAHAIDHMFLLIFATAVGTIAAEFGFARWEDLMPYGVGAFVLFGLGSLPSGRLGDLWGRRRMMLLFFFGIGVAALLAAATRSAPSWRQTPAAAICGMMFHIANELDDVRDDASLNALLEAIDLLEQGLPL